MINTFKYENLRRRNLPLAVLNNKQFPQATPAHANNRYVLYKYNMQMRVKKDNENKNVLELASRLYSFRKYADSMYRQAYVLI
jgi:hypothetical protein